MRVIKTAIEGAVIIEPVVHGDERGFFVETFQQQRYRDLAGIDVAFVQDNISRSKKGVVRGLHFQKSRPQGKLAQVTRGEVFDVILDIRPQSPTFGRWDGVMLNEESKHQLWIPPGLAHGFLVLSDFADFSYKCSDFYDAADEGCIRWNDPAIAIDWPLDQLGDIDLTVSPRDANAPTFAQFIESCA